MVDAIDAWVDVIFFAVAMQPLRRRPLRSLNFADVKAGLALFPGYFRGDVKFPGRRGFWPRDFVT